jgi:amidophosphoribosyltransferase
VIDDSIVRGTTLKKSIIKMLDRLGPKKIIIVSSAPQIDILIVMVSTWPKLGDFIAFQAAVALLQRKGTYEDHMKSFFDKCLDQQDRSKRNSEKLRARSV